MTLLDIITLALHHQATYSEDWERKFNSFLILAFAKGQLELDVYLEYLAVTQGDIIDTLQCAADDPYEGNTVAGDDGFTHPPDEKA